MKIEYIDFKETDRAILLNNIGAISNKDIDVHADKILPILDDIFGKGKCMYVPVREGDDFTLVIIKRS